MITIHDRGRYWLKLEGDMENLDGTFGTRLELTGAELKALLVLARERSEDRVRSTVPG